MKTVHDFFVHCCFAAMAPFSSFGLIYGGFPNKRTWEPSEKHVKAMLVKPAAISFQGEMPKRPAKVRHAFGSLKTALLVCVSHKKMNYR